MSKAFNTFKGVMDKTPFETFRQQQDHKQFFSRSGNGINKNHFGPQANRFIKEYISKYGTSSELTLTFVQTLCKDFRSIENDLKRDKQWIEFWDNMKDEQELTEKEIKSYTQNILFAYVFKAVSFCPPFEDITQTALTQKIILDVLSAREHHRSSRKIFKALTKDYKAELFTKTEKLIDNIPPKGLASLVQQLSQRTEYSVIHILGLSKTTQILKRKQQQHITKDLGLDKLIGLLKQGNSFSCHTLLKHLRRDKILDVKKRQLFTQGLLEHLKIAYNGTSNQQNYLFTFGGAIDLQFLLRPSCDYIHTLLSNAQIYHFSPCLKKMAICQGFEYFSNITEEHLAQEQASIIPLQHLFLEGLKENALCLDKKKRKEFIEEAMEWPIAKCAPPSSTPVKIIRGVSHLVNKLIRRPHQSHLEKEILEQYLNNDTFMNQKRSTFLDKPKIRQTPCTLVKEKQSPSPAYLNKHTTEQTAKNDVIKGTQNLVNFWEKQGQNDSITSSPKKLSAMKG